MEQSIYLIGLNHRTAGVDIRESFALTGIPMLEERLLPVASHAEPHLPLKEALVLSTCNRVEILAVGNDEGQSVDEIVLEAWAKAKGKLSKELRPYVYIYKDEEAIQHLFTVAASLDSMILGEPQILGQLKDAYQKALDLSTTKVILNRLLHRAFSVAKRVRNETGVASSAVSISYAAVELAKRIFGTMSDYKAMLIGAGEMAELAAAHLINAGIQSVLVSNRTFARAEELAKQFDGTAIAFEQLFQHLDKVDIVISSTGAPEAIIRAKDMASVMKARKNRPMFFIDIAVPRDIDPDVNALDNIYLYDIDDLKEVVEENLAQRREEAVKAKEIVNEETKGFCHWLSSLDLQPTIVDLFQHTESIIEDEINRTIKRLGANLSDDAVNALRLMQNSMVKKLNHEPVSFLKRRFQEEGTGTKHINFVRRIFNLDDENIPPEAHADRKRK